MAKKKLLQDSEGQIWPVTVADCVYLSDGSKTVKKYIDDVLSGKSDTGHTHNTIVSRGNVTCESGVAGRPGVAGLSMTQAYNNGYPTTYGNVINLRGTGDGQILVGWSGTDGAHAPMYVRSKRDNTSTANWSGWAQVYTTAHKPTAADIGAAASSHNHTSLNYVTSLNFLTEDTDSAAIKTTVSGTSTTMDFVMKDDYNNDYWRWRFQAPGEDTESNVMTLVPERKDWAFLRLFGHLGANNVSVNNRLYLDPTEGSTTNNGSGSLWFNGTSRAIHFENVVKLYCPNTIVEPNKVVFYDYGATIDPALPTQLFHGNLASYANLNVFANVDDNTNDEPVHIASGCGTAPTREQGIVVQRYHADCFGKRIYGKKYHTIDLTHSSYGQDTWFPCTTSIETHDGFKNLEVDVGLNSGSKPYWATHEQGFSVHFLMRLLWCGWGTNAPVSTLLGHTYSFCGNVSPVGYCQMNNSSTAVLYLRGGGRYYVKTDWNCNWTVHTSTYTYQENSVSPLTYNPGVSFAHAKMTGDFSGNFYGYLESESQTLRLGGTPLTISTGAPNCGGVWIQI